MLSRCPLKAQEWEHLRERTRNPGGTKWLPLGSGYSLFPSQTTWWGPSVCLWGGGKSAVWSPVRLRKMLPGAQALRAHPQAFFPATQQGLSSPEAQQWHLPGQQREPKFARQPARLQSSLVPRAVPGQGFIIRLGEKRDNQEGVGADCSIRG